jgi:hypothetical protein
VGFELIGTGVSGIGFEVGWSVSVAVSVLDGLDVVEFKA